MTGHRINFPFSYLFHIYVRTRAQVGQQLNVEDKTASCTASVLNSVMLAVFYVYLVPTLPVVFM